MCRQCPGHSGRVPACDCVPDTPAEFWLCRQCPGRAGSVLACVRVPYTLAEYRLCRQCPGCVGSVTACARVPDTLVESRLCRQCPGRAGSLLVCDRVTLSSDTSSSFFFRSNFQTPVRFARIKSWSRAPIVTDMGFGSMKFNNI